jgi:tRNA threonylcarbamoyladenosine biosynthesis protein TsaB
MSKYSLFLDSSHFIQVGIIDEDHQWVDHRVIFEKKGSSIIHGEIFNLLNKNDISFSDIGDVFIINGPGSYTGVRLAAGVAQVLELDGKNIYSFYHYEIPTFLGIPEGKWFSRAFKKEVFVYEWKDGEFKSSLLLESDFISKADFSNGKYYHLEDSFLGQEVKNTADLLEKNPKKIFSKVRARAKNLDVFYYRIDEKEFNLPKMSSHK